MKLPVARRPLALTLVSLLPALAAAASDWNQWRGPHRDGIVEGFKAPATWSDKSFAKRWSIAVGEGHSSPVVAGDRVFIFAREGDQEIMRCLALADGRAIWKEAYAAPYEMNPAARNHGKGPKSTPVVADGRVFALGINGHFSGWDAATGKVLWRKDFSGEFKATAPDFGTAASPIVDGHNVILHVGGEGSGALTAFDVATGKVNWKWTGDGPAYTSPIIATFGGVRQLITQSQKRCVAVSPADGKLLWEIPFATSYDQNSVTPVVVGDVVIFGGVGKPTFAVKVKGASAEQIWETREITMYMSTPVLSGTRLYGMSDKRSGMLFTMDVTNGTVLWKSDGRLGANASITDVGPVLLVMPDTAELSVRQKGGDELKELAKVKLADSPVWASPAVADDQLLIKDKTHLTLYRVGS